MNLSDETKKDVWVTSIMICAAVIGPPVVWLFFKWLAFWFPVMG